MGKYTKKPKIASDVAVMELSQPTSFGVRTRAAKTLALQRLRSSSSSARRLEKQQQQKQRGCEGEENGGFERNKGFGEGDEGFEDFKGEESLDFDGRDRCTRENTPCNLIRGLDAISNPCSISRRMNYQRGQEDSLRRTFPSKYEIEEFFAYAEQEQQRLFLKKYNYDIVNDLPLPGHYEWIQVVP